MEITLRKEIDMAKEYLKSMREHGAHVGDCDNVLMHLGKIEMLIQDQTLTPEHIDDVLAEMLIKLDETKSMDLNTYKERILKAQK